MRFPGRKLHFSALFLILLFISPLPAQEQEERAQSNSALECRLLPHLFNNYMQYHYAARTLDDAQRERTVEQFIRNLDPSKTLLLQSDIEKLRKDLPGLFSTMRRGDCSTLDDVLALLRKRAAENEGFVKAYLEDDFKLDRNITLVLDPTEREYAATLEERQAVLRKLIHFQMSNYKLAQLETQEAKDNLVRRYEATTKRLEKRTTNDMMESYVSAFARGLDPHSGFLSNDRMQDFRIQMELSLEGIGASLSSRDGFTIIEAIIPGGGAERSQKLKPQDKIIAVAQEDEKPVTVIDMDLSDVVRMIRGKKGTEVTLTILRQEDTVESFEVTIVRDKIELKDQAAKITYETREVGEETLTIGILELPSFYGAGRRGGRSSYEDMRRLLVEANEKGVDGLVLDLSRNSGGLLDESVKIAGLFLQTGAIVATRDFRGRIQVLADDNEDTVYSGPLTILVSRVSASASEILAGTLRAYGRALVVGDDHTFGKGSVQAVVPLPRDIGAMTVTTGLFFLPDGTSTQHDGVPSDIQIPSLFANADFGEKKLDHSIPTQTIDPFLSDEANAEEGAARWTPIDETAIQKLAALSRKRVEEESGFDAIRERLAEDRKNNGVVRIADLVPAPEGEANEKADEAETDGDTEKAKSEPAPPPGRTAREHEIRTLIKPMIQETVNITADLTLLQKGHPIKASTP